MLASFLPAVQAARRAVYVLQGEKLLNVQANGTVEEVPMDFASGENEQGLGTTGPLVSPDGRRVAFTKDDDLWIYDFKSQESRRLTRLGRKSDDTYASVYVLITSWSPDNHSILFYVAHSDPVDPEGVEPPREVRSVPYGFRVIDIERNAARTVRLTGEFQLWLPDGRFLLTSSEADYLHGALLVQTNEQDLPDRLTPVRGLWGQADASRDGRWLVASLGQPAPLLPDQPEDEAALTSRIVKLNLKNGQMTDVTPPGSWSEYQIPKLSPNGLRLSWVRQAPPDAAGFTNGTVFVDGKDVGSYAMPVEPRWIDDDTLVVVHSNGMDVIHADGKVILHRS